VEGHGDQGLTDGVDARQVAVAGQTLLAVFEEHRPAFAHGVGDGHRRVGREAGPGGDHFRRVAGRTQDRELLAPVGEHGEHPPLGVQALQPVRDEEVGHLPGGGGLREGGGQALQAGEPLGVAPGAPGRLGHFGEGVRTCRAGFMCTAEKNPRRGGQRSQAVTADQGPQVKRHCNPGQFARPAPTLCPIRGPGPGPADAIVTARAGQCTR
jgi:hypothetical protein